jgi:pyruvate/2-oxoglutarate dehydrogenase complex dihydrolipoamide dehydrogenase (E3) component
MSGIPGILPHDDNDQQLIANVHPPDWVNPRPAGRYNLVVIGAGTAGLVAAAGAAGLGARVALVERHLMGGDCLNYGCVPSKAVIRSSRLRADLEAASALGFRLPGGADVDFPAVMERMRRLRARISAHDSARRFRDLGVDVFLGEGRFTGPATVEVAGSTLPFRRAVIATGARPSVPAIPGLAEAGYLTNETVFGLTERPAAVAVIGGGPVGCEMAQALGRLGCQLTLFHRPAHLLEREDADAAAILQDRFAREGIRMVLGGEVRGVRREAHRRLVRFGQAGREEEIAVDAILVATGRAPNVEALGLEAAGVSFDATRGIEIDDRLQTTNPRIYAAGDVCLETKFTHAADSTARLVIQNALFLGRKKLSTLAIPWTTYTDPEIAHVGLYESEARRAGIETDAYTRHFKDVDRAITDGEEDGFVRILVKKGTDRILGATIVNRHAGEMIGEIGVAMAGRLGLGRLASVIHPYPTQAEAIRQIGDMYNRTRLTPFVKGLFRRWLAWTR